MDIENIRCYSNINMQYRERKKKKKIQRGYTFKNPNILDRMSAMTAVKGSLLPVFFDAIGESISPTAIFFFGHSVSTAQPLSFLFKGACCHCFQSTQGPFRLGICGRAGSKSMNWTWLWYQWIPPLMHQALKLKQPTLSFNNPSLNYLRRDFRAPVPNKAKVDLWNRYRFIPTYN